MKPLHQNAMVGIQIRLNFDATLVEHCGVFYTYLVQLGLGLIL